MKDATSIGVHVHVQRYVTVLLILRYTVINVNVRPILVTQTNLFLGGDDLVAEQLRTVCEQDIITEKTYKGKHFIYIICTQNYCPPEIVQLLRIFNFSAKLANYFHRHSIS